MSTKKLGLALLVILGFVGSQAWGAYFAAYWDENYATHWSDLSITIEIRDYFEAAGYEILDADQLKEWMDDRIADRAASVIIFCPDLAPETVVETNTADCTLRQYLDAGGKVVFHGDIPFYNQGNPGGGETNWGGGGSQGILGFNAAGATWDTGNTVTLTTEGQEWGSPKHGARSDRRILPTSTSSWLPTTPATPPHGRNTTWRTTQAMDLCGCSIATTAQATSPTWKICSAWPNTAWDPTRWPADPNPETGP